MVRPNVGVFALIGGAVAVGAVVASVDHAVRFHAAPDVADWTLLEQHSDWAGEGRTLIRAAMFRRDGTRICSISQEGLLRLEKTGG